MHTPWKNTTILHIKYVPECLMGTNMHVKHNQDTFKSHNIWSCSPNTLQLLSAFIKCITVCPVMKVSRAWPSFKSLAFSFSFQTCVCVCLWEAPSLPYGLWSPCSAQPLLGRQWTSDLLEIIFVIQFFKHTFLCIRDVHLHNLGWCYKHLNA